MTLKWKWMVPLAIMLAGCMQVFAADALTVDCNAPNVSIQIAAQALVPQQSASCIILPAETSYVSLNRETLLSKAVYAGQITAGEDGSAQLHIALPQSTAPKQYAVYVKTDTQLLEERFYFMDTQGKQQILDAFNGATADTIGRLLQEYSIDMPLLKIDTTGMYQQIASDINAALLSYRDAAGGFGSLENIEKQFNQLLALYAINHAPIEQLAQTLEAQAQALELELDEIYQQNKTAVLEIFSAYRQANSQNQFATPQQVQQAYCKSYITAQVNVIESVSEMDAWILQYAAQIGIDAEDYADYKNPTIGSALISQNFANAESIKEKIEQRMAQLDDTGSQAGGGGGASVSSGSSRPSGSGAQGPVYTPVQQGSPTQPSTEAKGFVDMDEAVWAADAIAYLHNAGVVNGKGNDEFKPNDAITRAEFAAILARGFSLMDAAASCSFSDVQTSDWYYQAVASLAKTDIVNGLGDGSFGANQIISRQDMAVMLSRVMEYCGIAPEAFREYAAFADQQAIASYAQQAVEYLYKINVINGMGDAVFAPQEGCTRAQVAKAVYDVIVISK